MFGQSLLTFTHPDDHAALKRHMIPTNLESLFGIQPADDFGEPRPRTIEEEEEIDRQLCADKRKFYIR